MMVGVIGDPMILRTLKLWLLSCCLMSGVALAAELPLVDWGRWSQADLAQLITTTRHIEAPGDRIAALSAPFLATPYVAGTMIGDPHTAERLVVKLTGFDCFTFLDVVEALRRASDLADFETQLQQVRYFGGDVAYAKRRHFFSDWVAADAAVLADVTATVGQGRERRVVKQLNRKADGTHWLPGIAVVQRELNYIPTEQLDAGVVSALQTGDYVGIYSPYAGLDVSHVGLVVRENGRVVLRHASSLDSLGRVVDVDLLEYLQGKPGLLVYRVR